MNNKKEIVINGTTAIESMTMKEPFDTNIYEYRVSFRDKPNIIDIEIFNIYKFEKELNKLGEQLKGYPDYREYPKEQKERILKKINKLYQYIYSLEEE